MPAIIAPGVVRFTVNGTYAGEPVANIVDMFIDTTGSTEGRQDAIFGQCGILINEWSDHVLPALSTFYSVQSVSWVDLDSLTGSTGERTSTTQETWPQTGTVTGAPAPGNVAYRITKQTVPTRGQRQGRMYLVGVVESLSDAANPNIVVGAHLTFLNTNMASFLGNLNQEDGGPTGYSSNMVVVHTVGGVFQSTSIVEQLVANQRLGSQRRRLDLS